MLGATDSARFGQPVEADSLAPDTAPSPDTPHADGAGDAADIAAPSDSAGASDGPDATATPPLCAVTTSQGATVSVSCAHKTLVLATGFFGLELREVHYQLPQGEAPPGGWPAAILFQGSLFSGELAWVGLAAAPFGMLHQVDTVRRLLDAGYAVITPEAHLQGATFWDTNIPPYAAFWTTSPDHAFMQSLFTALNTGKLGAVNAGRLYALGISSGGYMTSRMAKSYPGVFRALAVHSGSWATCAGPVCVVPTTLPGDHPPTLFAHGGADLVVPVATMLPYRDALKAQGVDTATVIEAKAGHVWLESAGPAIVSFFNAHP